MTIAYFWVVATCGVIRSFPNSWPRSHSLPLCVVFVSANFLKAITVLFVRLVDEKDFFESRRKGSLPPSAGLAKRHEQRLIGNWIIT